MEVTMAVVWCRRRAAVAAARVAAGGVRGLGTERASEKMSWGWNRIKTIDGCRTWPMKEKYSLRFRSESGRFQTARRLKAQLRLLFLIKKLYIYIYIYSYESDFQDKYIFMIFTISNSTTSNYS
jgi:hypothetical protein